MTLHVYKCIHARMNCLVGEL